jgi:hypothetical protein
MSGNVVVDRAKDVVMDGRWELQQQHVGQKHRLNDSDGDLYAKLKSLERQLEFLEIQVCPFRLVAFFFFCGPRCDPKFFLLCV